MGTSNSIAQLRLCFLSFLLLIRTCDSACSQPAPGGNCCDGCGKVCKGTLVNCAPYAGPHGGECLVGTESKKLFVSNKLL